MRGMRRTVIRAALCAAACSWWAGVADAATVRGVSFGDAEPVAGVETRLVGVGVRTKLFVKVYLGALYLATPTRDAAAAVAAEEPKRVVMHFLHSRVGAGKIREAWLEGFRSNVPEGLPALRERLDRFSSWFDEDLLAGDRIVLTYLPDKGVEVEVRGRARGVVEGSDFMRALWSVWLGEKPADAGLKKGMLGGS